MKICSICKLELDFINFQKDSAKKDGYRSMCKKCCSEHRKHQKSRNYSNPVPTVSIKECTKCRLTKDSTEFDRNCKSKDGLMIYCKECRVDKSREQYLKNKEKKKQQSLEYYQNNKESIRPKRQAYQNRKEKEDILFKLARRLRNRLYYALKRTVWKKGVKFNDYIGCSLEELKQHLEKQFIEGMTWDNYGQWHIDHHEPLSKAETPEEMHERCHYSNLKPMWAIDNIKKGNK